MIEATKRAMRDARLHGLQGRVNVLEEKNQVLHGIILAMIHRMRRTEVDPELLSIIGSYGDTLDDSEVLRLLKEWNETGKVIHEIQ